MTQTHAIPEMERDLRFHASGICRSSDPSAYWQHVPRADGDNVPVRG